MDEQSESIFTLSERIPLDADSPIPLYHQMEQIILERIRQPEMLNRMFPSEFELMSIFGVSRATIKKAMDNLVQKGLLERRRGIGTRVISQQITEDLARLKGYTEEMRSKGLQIRTKVLGVELHVPDEQIRDALCIGAQEKTICIRRLRGTDKTFPVVLLHSELPESLGIDPGDDFSGSLYQLLEQKYHVSLLYAEETIYARVATAEEAKLLGVKTASPVLIMERVSYTHNNQPVEFVRGIYRHDRYKFSIRLKR